MRASEIVTFINAVIEEHGDIKVTAESDMSNGGRPVTGFWTPIDPATGERVLIVCFKDA